MISNWEASQGEEKAKQQDPSRDQGNHLFYVLRQQQAKNTVLGRPKTVAEWYASERNAKE
jgi:hypothetical protein